MTLPEQHIHDVTETLCATVMGAMAYPASPAHHLHTGHRCLSGCVQISGGWNGAVVLSCTEAFSRRAAATMFGGEPHDATAADMGDALGELANMLGGNLKALLPGPSSLSLPSVAVGENLAVRIPGAHPVNELWFNVAGDAIVVAVHERIPVPA